MGSDLRQIVRLGKRLERDERGLRVPGNSLASWISPKRLETMVFSSHTFERPPLRKNMKVVEA